MTKTQDLQSRFESALELPDDWGVHKLANGTLEISGYDGEEMQEAAIEVIHGHITELVIQHSKMPSRASAQELDELDEPKIDVPIQAGVLQFDTVEDAISAADKLADPETLKQFASRRSPIENESPDSVIEAADSVTDIDLETVSGTTDSI